MIEIKNAKKRISDIVANLETIKGRCGNSDAIRQTLSPDTFVQADQQTKLLTVLANALNDDKLGTKQQRQLNAALAALDASLPDIRQALEKIHPQLPGPAQQIATAVAAKNVQNLHNQIDGLQNSTGYKDRDQEARQLITLGEALSNVDHPWLNLLRHILVEEFCQEMNDAIKAGRLPITRDQVMRCGSQTMRKDIRFRWEMFRTPHDADLGFIGCAPAKELADFCDAFAKSHEGKIARCGVGMPADAYKRFAAHQFCLDTQLQHNAMLFSLTPRRMQALLDKAELMLARGQLTLTEDEKRNLRTLARTIKKIDGQLYFEHDAFNHNEFSMHSINFAYRKAFEQHGQAGAWPESGVLNATPKHIPLFLGVDVRMHQLPPLLPLKDDLPLPLLAPFSEFSNVFLRLLEKRKSGVDTSPSAKTIASLVDMHNRYEVLHRGIPYEKVPGVFAALIALAIPARPAFYLQEPAGYFPKNSSTHLEDIQYISAPDIRRSDEEFLSRPLRPSPETRQATRIVNKHYESAFHSTLASEGGLSPEIVMRAAEEFLGLYDRLAKFPPVQQFLEACYHLPEGGQLDRNLVWAVAEPALPLLKQYIPDDVAKGEAHLKEILASRIEQGIVQARMVAAALGGEDRGSGEKKKRMR